MNIAKSEITLQNCNLSPNFGIVDITIKFEDNLVKTVNKENKKNLNFFEIYKNSDQFYFANNWIGSSFIEKDMTKKEREDFFKWWNSIIKQEIQIDIKTGEVISLFDYSDAPDEVKEIYSGSKKIIKTQCLVKNKYKKPTTKDKKEIEQLTSKKESFTKSLWRAFKDVMKENGKEYFNAAVDAYYGTGGLKSTQHCVTTDVGGKIQVFCKTY